jgi:diguanylate cyclase (GGDEF)-like protein
MTLRSADPPPIDALSDKREEVMRRFLLVCLVGAMALLAAGISGGLVGHTGELANLGNEQSHDATEQSLRMNSYFQRASSVILLTAHNQAFRDFYAQPGDPQARARQGGPKLDAVNDALSYLEQVYPNRMGKTSFVDSSGAEYARTVRGERAPSDTLSRDESQSPFFAPSLALGAGEVFQSKPYQSPDTNEWVIANASFVPMTDASTAAIVAFEVTIESFRRQASTGAGRTVLVVDADTGAVVINSTRPQQAGSSLGDPGDTRFRDLVGDWGDNGRLNLDGHLAAYERIAASPGNVNRWYVVSVTDQPVGRVVGVGIVPIVAVLAALLLTGYVLIAMHRGQNALTRAANTDPLTGLSNRRLLMADLDSQLARATIGNPLLLILCDLNGFKAYNDMFGHPAGDALLTRLGAALSRSTVGHGRPYRIGGDEFCILASPGLDGVDEVIELAARALSEHGDGFSITASHGAILLPADAATSDEAMRLVDIRMYENKNSGRVSADAQTTNALVRAMTERDAEWAERVELTADLAAGVCRQLGVPLADEARIRQAAQLHDLGKVGLPDDILGKPGPLTPTEWAFIQQCPSIGARIVSSARALLPLAPLVRAARERHDGTGYPDRLAGEDIPLGARIIAACAALTAMTSDRPHARKRELSAALAELRRCAGTQFDPQVVSALCDAAVHNAAFERTAQRLARRDQLHATSPH